jgi:uncharacterized protein YndB with AHSA1/START domain
MNPITVETTLNVPVEKAWQIWTEPSHITQWCQASDDWHAPYAENDVRAGGKFKTTMAAKDGSMQFDFEGQYSQVEPNKSIHYEMSDGRKVSILFSNDSGKTKITETFDPEAQHSEEMQRGGWQAILDNFRKYAESAA